MIGDGVSSLLGVRLGKGCHLAAIGSNDGDGDIASRCQRNCQQESAEGVKKSLPKLAAINRNFRLVKMQQMTDSIGDLRAKRLVLKAHRRGQKTTSLGR